MDPQTPVKLKINPKNPTIIIGIENTRPVVQFIAQSINSLTTLDANQDNVITWGEVLTKLPIIGLQATAAFQGYAQLKKEFLDLTAEERAELVALFNDTFDISNDMLEYLIEDYLLTLNQIANLVNKTTKFAKTIRA